MKHEVLKNSFSKGLHSEKKMKNSTNKKLLAVLAISYQLLAISFQAEAQYTDLINFAGTSSPQGTNPYGNVVLSGNKLYGMTDDGGANGEGCIYSLNTNGTGYKDLVDFNTTNGSNANPAPSLTLSTSGTVIYGMTEQGGSHSDGVIFSMDTSGNNYKVIYNFSGGAGGSNPLSGSGLMVSGHKLYGVTEYGGIYGDGNVFSIDTNGGTYTDLYDFTSADQVFCTLTLLAGDLYGVAYGNGGPSGYIFSLDTNGSGYNVPYTFSGAAGPVGGLVVSGTTLYGMTEEGGAGHGNVFSFNTSGNTYTNLKSFNGTTGDYPWGSLLLSGGVLYGMTDGGGTNGDGNIFSINTTGTGYTDLYSFTGTTGSTPYGSLTLSGNVLYGVTMNGGIGWTGGFGSGNGVVFSFIDNNIATALNHSSVVSGQLSVYPNPSTGIVNGKLSMVNEKTQLEVYNVLGEQIKQFTIYNSPFTIDLSSQPNGIYLYRVMSEDGNLIGEGKLIIQK